VHFIARLRPGRAVFTVADRGAGYEPDLLPDPTDPANLEKVSGRGLLLIRTFMDDVKFNRKGNRITMVKFDLTKPFSNRQGRRGSRKALE
jgi:anti-sigma regulatory factor (Ser/Thr protein kinase)